MKLTLVMLSLFIFAAGCGDQKTDTVNTANPGEIQPIVSEEVEQGSEGHRLVLSVCTALEQKQNSLDDYILHRTDISATYQESDCAGKMSAVTPMNVHLVARSNRYEFVADGAAFGLPEVETLDSGVMKEICNAINMPGLMVPIQTANRTAIDFRVVNVSKCATNSKQVCLLVKKGPMSIDGTKYRLSQVTLVSFETVRGNRPGFYAYKNEKSLGSCGSNKFRTKVATF